jgi:exodeoxyribonuclease-3
MFVPFVEQLQPDVICLQETKAQQSQSEVDLSDYEEYWNSATKKGYSGTAIFSKKQPLSVVCGLPADIVSTFGISNDGYGDPAEEGRVITAEYEDFYVISVYTPNAKEDLSRLALRHTQWDPAFLAYCKQLDKDKPVVLCGDLNVAHTADDLANPKANEGKKGFTAEERSGIDALHKAGFVDTFRMFTQGNGYYTWWSHFANSRARNVGWRIDYCFVSERLTSRVASAHIHPDVQGSDHCPISVVLKDA